MTQDRRNFLIHALDCIDFMVGQLATVDKQKFLENRLMRDAVLHNLEIVGQAFKDHGIESLEDYRQDIRWRQIAGFRNQLAQAYLGIDHELIWGILSQHLGPLRQAIAQHLEASR